MTSSSLYLRKFYCILGALVCLSFNPIYAQNSYIVLEAYSGKILVASNANAKLPIASLTKIATGTIAIDWANNRGLDIAKIAITIPNPPPELTTPSPLNLRPGDTLTMRDALYAALLASDNVAAHAIAHHVGSEILNIRNKNTEPATEFVAEMNRLAKGLFMSKTRFGNPHGLEYKGLKAYSTAADIARLSVYAMRKNAFNYIVRQPERQISVTTASGPRSYLIKNTNELIHTPDVLGVKTGTSAAAGPCLSVCMDKAPLIRTKPDGTKGATPRRLFVVTLNDPDRFNHTRSLLDAGWARYDSWLALGAPVKDKEVEIIKVTDPE